MINLKRTEEMVYRWCNGDGRNDPSGPAMANLYVGACYPDLPLIRLSDFKQLDVIRHTWAMALINGVRDGSLEIPTERASKLAAVYHIHITYDASPELMSDVPMARSHASIRRMAETVAEEVIPEPVETTPIGPAEPISVDEVEHAMNLTSVHGVILRWWEEEQVRARKPKARVDSTMDGASWALLGHLRTYNKPYVQHLKRYAEAGWSIPNLATTLQRYYEQIAAKERNHFNVEERTLVECTLTEVDWEAIVKTM